MSGLDMRKRTLVVVYKSEVFSFRQSSSVLIEIDFGSRLTSCSAFNLHVILLLNNCLN